MAYKIWPKKKQQNELTKIQEASESYSRQKHCSVYHVSYVLHTTSGMLSKFYWKQCMVRYDYSHWWAVVGHLECQSNGWFVKVDRSWSGRALKSARLSTESPERTISESLIVDCWLESIFFHVFQKPRWSQPLVPGAPSLFRSHALTPSLTTLLTRWNTLSHKQDNTWHTNRKRKRPFLAF